LKKKLRHEIKFHINRGQYELLKSRIKAVLKKDENTLEEEHYHIRSLYFDGIYNQAMRQKISGIEKRKKYRIRIYNLDDSVIKLECKEKTGDQISKRTITLDKEFCEDIIRNDYFFDGKMPLDFYFDFKTNLLKPVVIVDYEREAYVYKYGNVRITFDKNLETSLDTLDLFEKKTFNTKVLEDDVIIMEVKYDNYIPNFIKHLTNLAGVNQSAISKYTLCRFKLIELTNRR